MTDMERILENISDVPPEDVVEDVTPWKRAMGRILLGIAITAVTLNFLCLNYILPAIGAILVMLGFRALRRENKWFNGCYLLSVSRTAFFYTALVLDATVISADYDWLFVIANTLLQFLIYICLRNGLVSLQKKAGLPVSVGGANGLIVWYVLIFILAIFRYQGYVIAIGMLVCYGFIIKSLSKISAEIGCCGYAVTAAEVKVSDRLLVIISALVLAVGLALGYTFGASYPMKWTLVNETDTDEVTEIKEHLISLGFPDDILDDLTREDILECEGALAVTVDTKDFPINDGRKVTEYRDNGFYTTTVYDSKELCITGVAVKLPCEREQWKIIHHFKWVLPHSKYGTECLQLWPAYRQGNGWTWSGDVSGRVLCDIDGAAYSSEYYYLGSKSYRSDSILFGSQTSTDIFAEYSMNKNGENHRGYLSYTTAVSIDGYILDSWINYTHQKTWLQFPAKTAMEYRMNNVFGIGGAFVTVQDALQMHKGELI